MHESDEILAMQRAKELINQDMFENLIRPINNLEDGYLRELELLEKQQRLNEDAVEVESRIRACFERFAEAVDNLDSDGVRALLRRFKIRIVGTKERMVVMGVVDPRVFTTGHTSASRRAHSCLIRPDEILPGWMSW